MRTAFRVPTLSAKERVILELLTHHGELYGLQMVAASKRRLRRGTIYVTLGRMQAKGYVTSQLEEPRREVGGMPRRLYTPTALGRRVLAAWDHVAEHLVPELAS
jgi:PadR family transcriptional regulator, regulatory protein PadR